MSRCKIDGHFYDKDDGPPPPTPANPGECEGCGTLMIWDDDGIQCPECEEDD